MPTFEIRFHQEAIDDLRYFKKFEQKTILDSISQQLESEPLSETRNRKPLRPNELSQWELRAGRYRVFYDVEIQGSVVPIKSIGWKEHNTLWIRGKEFTL